MKRKRKKNSKVIHGKVEPDKLNKEKKIMDNSALHAELQALAVKYTGTITGTFTPDDTSVDSFSFVSNISKTTVNTPAVGDKTLARLSLLVADEAAGVLTSAETEELVELRANPPTA
jgi:hypothetical protein